MTSLSVAQLSQIVSANNDFWSTTFYTDAHVTKNYQVHCIRGFENIQFLNAASVIRSAEALPEIEAFMQERQIPCALWIDPYTPLSSEFLEERGFKFLFEESEIYRVLDLQSPQPDAEEFLRNIDPKSVKITSVDF